MKAQAQAQTPGAGMSKAQFPGTFPVQPPGGLTKAPSQVKAQAQAVEVAVAQTGAVPKGGGGVLKSGGAPPAAGGGSSSTIGNLLAGVKRTEVPGKASAISMLLHGNAKAASAVDLTSSAVDLTAGSEPAAVEIVKKALASAGGSCPMAGLSTRVKWGEERLANLGNFRPFLKKNPDAFQLEGANVKLA